MIQFANRERAWRKFIETQSIADDVPIHITDSWRRSWPRVNFSKGLNLPRLSPEHFISAQIASFDLSSIASSAVASGFTEMAVYQSQRITYDDQSR